MASEVLDHTVAHAFIRVGCATDVGRKREENQDSFGVFENEVLSLYAVADGMGGVKGGATASAIAIQDLKNSLSTVSEVDELALISMVRKINGRIFEEAGKEASLRGMGTTLVALAFSGVRLFVINVGDSRAYRLRSGVLTRLTHDHTLVMELLLSGAITREQVEHHPVSHMLTRSLGPSPEVEVDCLLAHDGPVRGDRYLLCSDGLHGCVSDTELKDLLENRSVEEAAQLCVARANEKGGNDNITAVVLEVTEDFPVHSVTAQQMTDLDNAQRFSPTALGAAARFISGLDDVKSASSLMQRESPKTLGSIIKANRPRFIYLAFAFLIGSISAGIFFFSAESLRDHLSAKRAHVAHETPTSVVDAKTDGPSIGVLAQQRNTPTRNVIPEGQPQIAPPSFEKPALTARDKESLTRRKDILMAQIARLDTLVSYFESPPREALPKLIAEAEERSKALRQEHRASKMAIDEEARKLTVWVGRRRRLDDSDVINIANELLGVSEEIVDQKNIFDKATWDYLRELENQRYNPSDQNLNKKVSDLIAERNRRLRELSEAVHRTIKNSIDQIQERIADLTVQHDIIQAQYDASLADIEHLKLLVSGSDAERAAQRMQLINTRDLALIEISELSIALGLNK